MDISEAKSVGEVIVRQLQRFNITSRIRTRIFIASVSESTSLPICQKIQQKSLHLISRCLDAIDNPADEMTHMHALFQQLLLKTRRSRVSFYLIFNAWANPWPLDDTALNGFQDLRIQSLPTYLDKFPSLSRPTSTIGLSSWLQLTLKTYRSSDTALEL